MGVASQRMSRDITHSRVSLSGLLGAGREDWRWNMLRAEAFERARQGRGSVLRRESRNPLGERIHRRAGKCVSPADTKP
jgi:hypothetical protein